MSPYSIFIAKPMEMSFAEALSRLRMWLDTRKIEIASFKLSAADEFGFEMLFKNERDASTFNAEFAWHLPPV